MIDKLWCLDDRGGWGRALAAQALARGLGAELFTSADLHHVESGTVFARVDQAFDRRVVEQAACGLLADRGLRMIPDRHTIACYEDKLAQAELYKRWMPPTLVLRSAEAAERTLGVLGYPFISKSRTGSASRNVRLIYNEAGARAEIEQAFGGGLDAPHRLGEHVQRGYLIWQRFEPHNAYDYRVVRTGQYMMILQRHNRPDVPFASGSGVNNPAKMSCEVESALWFAHKFFTEESTPWCGIDLVRGGGSWYVLETTLGWSQAAYLDCPYYWVNWDCRLTQSKYTGRDIWAVTCNEIAIGGFN